MDLTPQQRRLACLAIVKTACKEFGCAAGNLASEIEVFQGEAWEASPSKLEAVLEVLDRKKGFRIVKDTFRQNRKYDLRPELPELIELTEMFQALGQSRDGWEYIRIELQKIKQPGWFGRHFGGIGDFPPEVEVEPNGFKREVKGVLTKLLELKKIYNQIDTDADQYLK